MTAGSGQEFASLMAERQIGIMSESHGFDFTGNNFDE